MKKLKLIAFYLLTFVISFGQNSNTNFSPEKAAAIQSQFQLDQAKRQAKAKKNQTMGATQLLEEAQKFKNTEKKQSNKGQILQGVGSMIQASAMMVLAVAELMPATDAASKQAKDQTTLQGVMLLTAAMGQFTGAAGAFANAGAAGQASQNTQNAGLSRLGEGAGDSNPELVGESNRFDLNHDGKVTSGEVEQGLGPDARSTLDSLSELSPAGTDLKNTALNAIAEGKDPHKEVEKALQMRIPTADQLPDVLKSMQPGSTKLAENLSKAGAPYHDLMAAIQNPDLLKNPDSNSLNSPELSSKLDEKGHEALDQIKNDFKQGIDLSSGGGGVVPSGNALDYGKSKLGLFSLDALYSKDTDLENKAFGKGGSQLFRIPGMSHDPVKSIFEVIAHRYFVILNDELKKDAYIVNGELVGLRHRVSENQVRTTLQELKNKDSFPAVQGQGFKQKRIPTSLP